MTLMNILLTLVSSVLATSTQSYSSDCPTFIAETPFILYPDILCGYTNCSYTDHPYKTIFGYVPSHSVEFFDVYSKTAGAAVENSFGSCTTKIGFDSFILSLSEKIFGLDERIADLVYEMIVRYIFSFVLKCTYPGQYASALKNFNCGYYDFKIEPKAVFCSLLKQRSTRTIVIIVLDCLKTYYAKIAKQTQSTTFCNDGSDLMTVAYAKYLCNVVDKLIKTAINICVICDTDTKTVASKSFVMLPNNYTNGNGSFVIDVTTSMDKNLVF